ncbi:MAG: hypothetical protein ACI4PH_04745 [Faecousia sp.]
MKIIMRRVFVIFYPENHENGNAVWRCLLDKNEIFLSRNSMKETHRSLLLPQNTGPDPEENPSGSGPVLSFTVFMGMGRMGFAAL